jgi:hypothetical protein
MRGTRDERKPFHLLSCLNPFEYSWLLPLILIMRFGRWTSRLVFLNEHLDKDIYMLQPYGFIANNQEDMVCKLQRSIYGLKQAS